MRQGIQSGLEAARRERPTAAEYGNQAAHSDRL
jgi:hypothetical protein